MKPRKKNKADHLGIGFLIGFMFPLLIFFVVYVSKGNEGTFLAYLSGLWHLQALVKLASLCVFANVAIFWIFIKLKYEKAARGVLGATILYAFVVLISRAV